MKPAWQPDLVMTVAAKLCFWGLVASLLMTFAYRRGLRVLDHNGG